MWVSVFFWRLKAYINGPTLNNGRKSQVSLCVEEIVQKKIETQDITKYLVLDHSRIGAEGALAIKAKYCVPPSS